MGEAKRRKQLGLMPTLFPFEAEMQAGGKVTLRRGPEDAAQRELIVRTLEQTQASGAAWEAEYRTVAVVLDRSGKVYRTREEVGAIPVPPLRRITGDLALGPVAAGNPGIPVNGGSLRLREQVHSFDGEKWETFPRQRDPQRVLAALQHHPAFSLQGESLGQFQVDHWPEGRIDITPDPPEEVLEFLEDVVRDFHGQDRESWLEQHRKMVEESGEDVPPALLATPPLTRRLFFELRRSSPLQNPLQPVAYFRDLEIYLLEGAAYTLDGDTWHPYADPVAEIEEAGLAPELAEFFDLNTVTVTVYADGRIEWDEEEEISEKDAEQIRRDLPETTGAGDPAAWAVWARQALTETFGEELQLPPGSDFPVPVAFRLDIPRDVLGDDNPLSQTYMESEVSFDGETWRDLFDEEIPEELAAFAAGRESN